MAEEKKKGLFSRLGGTFRAVRSEMKKVVWPSKKQVVQNTAVVFSFVFVSGIFIWTVDAILQFLVNGLFNIIK